MDRIRLLLVDDHQLFREGLSRLLSSEPDFEVVGHCGRADEALGLMQDTPVDLILLDFVLGSGQSDEFLSRLREAGPAIKVLMVTARMNAKESLQALQQGASGIFLKHGSPLSLIRVIRLVAAGEVWVDPKVIQLLAESAAPILDQAPRRPLTEREEQVLRGVLEGHTNRRIAVQLGVSEGAVKAVLQQLFEKAGVRTRSQLVRVALEGWLGTGRAAR